MLRLGLLFASVSYGLPADELFARIVITAQAAERSGFDSVWAPDHMLQGAIGGGPGAPMLEAYTLLGGLAASTERVRLGAMVSPVTFRHPSLLAKAVITLDVLSRGRAVLGLGAAWDAGEHTAYGIDFPPMRERQDRLEETAQICRLLLTEPVASFAGQFHSITEATASPRPVQARVPILIAGGGEKRTLRTVARYGDACNLAGPAAEIRRKLDVLDRHCDEAGRDRSEITTTCIIEPAENIDELVASVGERFDAGADGAVILANKTPDPATVAAWGDALSAAFAERSAAGS